MPRRGWTTVDVPEGWLKVIRGQRPPSVKWAKAEKKTERKSSAAITTVEDSNASTRGGAASFAGSRPSCVRGPVQGGEVGGRDQCSGRERPSGSTVERGVATRAFSGSGSSGSTHYLDQGPRSVWRACGTDLVKAQEAVAKAQETLRHEEAFLRDGEHASLLCRRSLAEHHSVAQSLQ